ncbi:metallophosphoesterase family protein [Pseudomonas avellanae]|uniref:metallophosphoesterase family protein n=1 Tax=Pseudomonas avellanae TaxID=46257 RepID=UPI0004627CC5|nr:metallophosphoesterase family protein [Pseudomonas avellanae]UQW68069.1 metallophosphoesterase family protein [Pseudomonas avellanae]GGJ47606.1 serine/threonine protein phosphatase [Pseudomonas avellanae]
MKVYVLSDLHAEFEPFVPPSLEVDLVVLAGDINKKTRGIEWANDTFSCDVVYVLGNHEYYTGHFDRTLDKARKAAASHVHVLENDTFIWKHTRFLGCTAWTDFSSTGDVSAAMSVARETMTDFRAIRADTNFRRLRPDDVAARNRQAKAWLTAELQTPFNGRSIVVTHHAPVWEVAGDEHEGHLTAAYCNSWHSLLMQADGWIFGHTHRAVDTVLGGCRAVSNPRGYPGEQTGFNANKVIEF